jgi:electron transfer flavoprotein alpha subunit
MARTGILIETENNAVKETSLGVMTAAAGQEIIALVTDADPAGLREKLAAYGAAKIVKLGASGGDVTASPDLLARALAAAVKEFDLAALAGTASTTGKDVFARLAAVMDLPLVSDCVALDIAAKTAKKSHFSGKTFATLKVDAPVLLATVRPNAIEAKPAEAAGDIAEFIADAADPGQVIVREVKKGASGKIDLTEAPIIITGGRAIKAAENYRMLEACAAKIGAAVGASRAAVRRRIRSPLHAGGPDRENRVSPSVYRLRGIRGGAAFCRHENLQGDRGHQR